MSGFIGKWKLVDSRDFDKVMVELGVGYMTRKIAENTKPTVTITKFGEDGLTMKTESTFKTSEISFQFGVEFDETTADGRQVKSTVTKDSDYRITQVQKHPNADTHIVRQVENDIMDTTVTVRDVVSHRRYQRIK
ncbi:Fatty acid-binding protein type V [Fasciola hepatica]|nr:fatty acid-binding protein type V [Fasciola hepatica]AJO53794.1 fatty acid-binding protein type V [Fasciola gigantica]THD26047.1 Fatty acid-binding protein type V [Fasciola hepatica]